MGPLAGNWGDRAFAVNIFVAVLRVRCWWRFAFGRWFGAGLGRRSLLTDWRGRGHWFRCGSRLHCNRGRGWLLNKCRWFRAGLGKHAGHFCNRCSQSCRAFHRLNCAVKSILNCRRTGHGLSRDRRNCRCWGLPARRIIFCHEKMLRESYITVKRQVTMGLIPTNLEKNTPACMKEP